MKIHKTFSKHNIDLSAIGNLLKRAKKIAKEYRKITERPLGITGEVAEYEAARLLGLDLCRARQAGYDATNTEGKKIQIKGRVIFETTKPGQKVGGIRLEHKWDLVLLVLLDEDFAPLDIYEANRRKVIAALKKPGSKSRNERGALSVNQFKSIARHVWSRKLIAKT